MLSGAPDWDLATTVETMALLSIGPGGSLKRSVTKPSHCLNQNVEMQKITVWDVS